MVYVMGVQIGMAIALDRVLGGGFPEGAAGILSRRAVTR